MEEEDPSWLEEASLTVLEVTFSGWTERCAAWVIWTVALRMLEASWAATVVSAM